MKVLAFKNNKDYEFMLEVIGVLNKNNKIGGSIVGDAEYVMSLIELMKLREDSDEITFEESLVLIDLATEMANSDYWNGIEELAKTTICKEYAKEDNDDDNE